MTTSEQRRAAAADERNDGSLPASDGSPRALDRPVFCISHVYGHHAAASGYHHIGQLVGRPFELSPRMRTLGNTVIRLPAKIAAACTGVYEYNRHSVTGEVAVAADLLRRRNGIYHFLYAEKGYWFAGRLNRVRGNSLVGTFHYPPSRFDEMVQKKRHLRHLEHAIAVGRNQLEMLERHVGAGKVSFVPHGIDNDYWQPSAERRESGPWQCVFAGIHMRDYETLEAAIRKVRSARRDVEFTLLSSDVRCESIAQVEGVRWLKRTSDDEYRSIIRESDLMFLPLTDSTAVNSVLEALACGVPVITNAGGIEDYLNPDCGRVHPRGDVDGMVESLLDVLGDVPRLREMQAAARRQALTMDWSVIAAQTIDVYRRLGLA